MTTPLTLKQPATTAILAVLCFVPFFVIFNSTLVTIAAPYVVGDLGGSNDTATYPISFFSIGNAAGIPLAQALLARIGPARFLKICLLLFLFFSCVCILSPNYPFFNAIRFFQGFVSGPLYVINAHIFFRLQPPEKAKLFSIINVLIFVMTPVIGACIGGWIAYQWGWRYAFYPMLPCMLFMILFLHDRLEGFDESPLPKKTFDAVGYTSFFFGIVSLCTGIILGQELDWFRSSLITTLLIVGALLILFFIIWEWNTQEPILDLKILKIPVISFALLNLAVLFSCYFGIVILLSLWLKLWVNYTPDWIAALLGIMALTALFPPLLIAHPRFARIDNRVFLIIAILLLLISSLHTMTFNVEVDLKRVALSRLSAGLSLAFFLTPIFKICFSYFSPLENKLRVFSLLQVVRALSSGLGASVYAVIWLRRQVFFHERLGSSLTVFSGQTQEFFSKAKILNIQGEAADAQLEYYLERQSTALALDDCFYLMVWILIGLLIAFGFTLFVKPRAFIPK